MSSYMQKLLGSTGEAHSTRARRTRIALTSSCAYRRADTQAAPLVGGGAPSTPKPKQSFVDRVAAKNKKPVSAVTAAVFAPSTLPSSTLAEAALHLSGQATPDIISPTVALRTGQFDARVSPTTVISDHVGPGHSRIKRGCAPAGGAALPFDLRSHPSMDRSIQPAPKIARYNGGGKDDTYWGIHGSLGGATDICVRCKYPECPGIVDVTKCPFASNCFFAKKALVCDACGTTMRITADVITKMTRGKYQGRYIHRACASMWYSLNPEGCEGSAKQPLTFHHPPVDLANFLDAFSEGKLPLAHIDATAGSGKTNALIYVCNLLRAKGARFIVLVFNRAACNELASRGLTMEECMTFHAFLYKAYKSWIMSRLIEYRIMTMGRTPLALDNAKVEPTVCYVKIRLVVSFFYRNVPAVRVRQAYINLLRPFVAAIVDQARIHAFGCVGYAAMDDLVAYKMLVDKYNLARLLEDAWRARLSHPDKHALLLELNCERAEDRLAYALSIVPAIFKLSIEFATNDEVQGHGGLYNEAKKTFHRAPVVDYIDMEYLQNYLELNVGSFDFVLGDELHDMTCNHGVGLLKAVQKPGGALLGVSDVSQYMNGWLGVELDTLQRYVIANADVFQNANNYRCGRAIVAHAQECLTDMQSRDMTIVPRRDVEGVVLYDASFYNHPIDNSKSTLVLCRMVRHAFRFYIVLLGKGYNVQMHGLHDTQKALLAILNETTGPLQFAVDALTAELRDGAPSDTDARYDYVSALSHAAVAFLDSDPSVDAMMPEARDAFEQYVQKTYATKSGITAGAIVCSSIHAAKGLEADHVFIGQPSLLPMKARIERGGWEETEEKCVVFVARTRARDILQYLPNVEDCTRDAIMKLFEPPENAQDFCGSAGESDGSQSQEAKDKTDTDAEDSAEAEKAVKNALATLGLAELPATLKDLRLKVKELLMKTHPDRTVSSSQNASLTEQTQKILDARAVLVKVIGD